ncbi:MAG: DUF4352 domain-containing protein [Clostridia bacterium]|nr:DUF4352 domain-containing protein [Clostridia bacterium]
MENENNVQVKKKKSKKKWIVLAVIAVVLIAILSSGGSEEPTVETLPGETTTAENSQSDTKEITVGSSVTNDEVKISYKTCNADFKKYSSYADVKSGYKVIEAVFDFENISSTDIILEGFDCYADGVKCEEFYSVDDYSSPTLESVSAGRKLTDAKVYFEVPKDAELIELEYEADYWSGEKYIFIVE